MDFQQVSIERNLKWTDAIDAQLFYFRSGGPTLLQSIIRRALEAESLHIAADDIKSFSRLAIQRLYLFGFLELSDARAQGQWRWSARGDRILRLPSGSFIAFGSIAFKAKVSELSGGAKELLTFYEFPRRYPSGLGLVTRVYDISKKNLGKLIEEYPSEEAILEPQKLVDALPTAATLLSKLVTSESAAPKEDEFTNVSVMRASGGWTGPKDDDDDALLLRVDRRHEPPSFFIPREGSVSKGFFRLKSGDWHLILVSLLKNYPLGWKFDEGLRELMVPTWQMQDIPVLLRKALISPSFRWPEIREGYYVFSQFPKLLVNRLIRKYPFIGIDHG